MALDATAFSMSEDGFFENTYLAQSSIENYASIRDPDKGAPYIQTFCKTLKKYFNIHDVIEIFNAVSKQLKNYEIDGRRFKITPQFSIIGVSKMHNIPLKIACQDPEIIDIWRESCLHQKFSEKITANNFCQERGRCTTNDKLYKNHKRSRSKFW